MRNINERVAVMVALVVVGGVLGVREFSRDLPVSLPLIEDVAHTPSLGIESVSQLVTQAWEVWQVYLVALQEHDHDTVKKLSTDLSPTCMDPEQRVACFQLFDALYNLAGWYTLDEFIMAEADEKQIVLYTSFIEVKNEAFGLDTTMQSMLYFTRDFFGEPKVLGMRFCWPDDLLTDCVETDPNQRDLNGNGWWDELESLFH